MEPTSESLSPGGLSAAGLTDWLLGPAPSVPARLPAGTRLGDVTIVRFLAEGGMGQVYEGLQGMPCRTVAVKLVRAGAMSPAALKRFEYEAQLLGRMSHPGIARIYAMGVERVAGHDLPYFVMEYVAEARPLVAYARERDLALADRLEIFRTACQAVAHGHQRGVIHRDLKPGNMLVDGTGQPRIIDFGVARSVAGDAALTTMHTDFGQLLGTLQYMSPEQLEGEVDTRADVYALGLVLFELLTGRMPYDLGGRAVYEAARIVREVVPPRVGTIDRRLRGDVETIVATCLAKHPAERYSSASELEADLGRLLAGEPIAASPPRLGVALLRLARRHRLAALFAGGMLTLLVAGSVAVALFAVQAARERAVAVREQARADAGARAARQQTAIANLRSLQACLASRNLRMGRQLFAETRALVGEPLPLEMHLLGAELDDAIVVLESRCGPVNHLAYAPDGRWLTGSILAATEPQVPDMTRSRQLHGRLRSKWRQQLCFAVGGGLVYIPAPPPAGDWLPAWRLGAGVSPAEPGSVPGAPPVLAISPDGRCRAVQAADGGVRILDSAADGAVMIEGFHGRSMGAALSPDTARLVIQGPGGELGLWDTATGRQIARLAGSNAAGEAFLFSPDGSRVAVVVGRMKQGLKTVHVHASADGRELCTITQSASIWAPRPLVAFAPDGGRVVTAGAADGVCVWDATNGRVLARAPGPGTALTALAVGPDGRRIAGGVVKGTVRLWDLESGEPVRDLLGHDDSIVSLAFSPDGRALASSDLAGPVRIWDPALAGSLAVLPDVRGLVASGYSPDGRLLAIAARDPGGVTLWDPHTVTRVHALEGPSDRVTSLAVSPDGGLVAAAFELPERRGEVRVWATATGVPVATLEETPRPQRALVFGPDGRRLLTTSAAGVVAVWDPRTGERLWATEPAVGLPTAAGAAFGLGGTRVAGTQPYLLDAATGAAVVPLPAQLNLTSLQASPTGTLLAVGIPTGTVRLIDFTTGRWPATLVGHTGAVHALAFDTAGGRIVTGGVDGTARLWDVHSGAALAVLAGHDGSVEHCVFSGDGRRIVTVATDGAVRIWETEGGRELCVLPGQPEAARAVSVSPDGTALVAAGPDGRVRIWGPSNAAVVAARQAVSPSR